MSESLRDSRSMDPVFEQVVKSLYGDSADPREFWELSKIMPDQSSLHAKGTNKKREKRIAAVGLGATGVATIGGLHALKGTKAEHDIKSGKVKPEPWKPGKVLGRISGGNTRKAAAIGTAGWVGLHGVELAADALAIRAQSRALKDASSKPKNVHLKKAVFPYRIVRTGTQQGLTQAERAFLQRKAKNSQKVLIGGAIAAAGVGGYKADKKYNMKRVPPASSTAVKPVTPKKRVQKSEIDLVWEGQISKMDVDKRLVFGWCSLSKVDGAPVVDLQGDYIPIEETETAAYKYVIESRKGGDMHRRVQKFEQDEPLHTADLVESMVITPEKLEKLGLPPDSLPHGWWVGFKVNDDEQWRKVKSGERLGFSVHGKGRRVEKALD